MPVPLTVFQMERAEKNTEESDPTARVDLEHVLRGLRSMSECMDNLARMSRVYHTSLTPAYQ